MEEAVTARMLMVIPQVGVGPVLFGMSRTEVREALGGEATPFYKTVAQAVPTDAFRQDGIHVYYREPGMCEAVELMAPAVPLLGGDPLLGRPFALVRAWLERVDPALVVDRDGLTSYELGLALSAPGHDEVPGAPAEAVLVFERGYHERHVASAGEGHR